MPREHYSFCDPPCEHYVISADTEGDYCWYKIKSQRFSHDTTIELLDGHMYGRRRPSWCPLITETEEG
jgi:hypothetical protein